MLWCNDFRIYIPLVTSCAKRAVPVRVPDRIVRVAASHTVIATVVEVAEAPPSTDPKRVVYGNNEGNRVELSRRIIN